MVTLVLLLALFVAFLSIVMTVGNALNRTNMAKVWSIIATVAILVTTLTFIIDTMGVIEAKEADITDEVLRAEEGMEGQAIESSALPDLSGNNLDDKQNPSSISKIKTESGLARMMLLDLYTKHFSGNLSGLTAAQKEWIRQHASLYPADTENKLKDVENLSEGTISIEEMISNMDQYKQAIIHGSGTVLEKQVEEQSGIGEMQVHVLSPDGGIYILYYPAITPLEIGDKVQFYGTPIVSSKMSSDMLGPVSAVLIYSNYITQ